MYVVFCCKRKTAYEMRISDWSSDVCSSDLGIGMFLATQPRCGEAVADLNTLDRIDAHASRRQYAVELGVKRRAPAGRNAGRDTFDHSAQRRTILACAIDQDRQSVV